MKESKFYQEILEEGRREGALRAWRTSILEVLDVRFGAELADEFRAALEKIENLRLLGNLLDLAVCSRRRTEFRRWFANPGEARKRIPTPYQRRRKRQANRKAKSGRNEPS